MVKIVRFVTGAGLGLVCGSVANGGLIINTVTVRNPGNPDDVHIVDGQFCGAYGGVDYVYGIGKYEVTAREYTEFLNAVAKTDTHGLYNTSMWDGQQPCMIERHGTSGSYWYSVAPDWADRPVNYVSFWDAARFANWMHNGQGDGDTETGSYTLSGYTGPDGKWISRNPGATWVIPTVHEWYKAAYHKNDGITDNYWDYPTGTDVRPSNELIDPDPGNNGNFPYDGQWTIGEPYWRTEVGEFENSESPYGTFDQCGNVWEWDEALWHWGGLPDYSRRGLRGGSFVRGAHLPSSYGSFMLPPDTELAEIGFRVAFVPEPGTVILMLSGILGILHRRKRWG